MAGSANAFCKAHPDPNPAGQELAAHLDLLVTRANTLVQQQRSTQMAGSAAVDRKQELRRSLGALLKSLVDIARTASRNDPEITIHLRRPRGNPNYATLIAFGRVAIAETAAHKEAFLKLGMPSDLLDRLTAELDECEASILRHRSALADQVGAGADLAAVTHQILVLLKHIDAIQRLRFRDDPELAAAWNSARNVAYRGAVSASDAAGSPPASGEQAA
jgi:hypothetical protein